MTLLHYGAALGHQTVLKEVLNACDEIDAVDVDGATPLYYAANYGHEECVKILLNHGAQVNHSDQHGRSPLMCAVVSGVKN